MYATPNSLLSGRGCNICKREKISNKLSKRVICVETGIVYKSSKAAADSVGVSQCCISDCCRGVQKTSGGYRWKYCDE